MQIVMALWLWLQHPHRKSNKCSSVSLPEGFDEIVRRLELSLFQKCLKHFPTSGARLNSPVYSILSAG